MGRRLQSVVRLDEPSGSRTVEPRPVAPAGYIGPDPHMTPGELERLRSLRGSFAGNRIFVMGNGPSLNNMDLELLADDYVFCVNRISLLLSRISWTPEFFMAFDLRVVPDNLDEFNDLEIPYKFFATKHKGAIEEKENHYWYHDKSTANDLLDRFTGTPELTGMGGGGTVTTAAIQIAHFLGFDPIILIGCDASYTIRDSVQQSGPDKFGDGVKLNLVSSEDDDPNHFDPSYFGKGKRWHSPNAAEMHIGFEKSFRAMATIDRTLVNATVGGALDSVPRVDYGRLFVSVDRKAAPIVGIDLVSELAAKPTGMRNSLMSTLRNVSLLGTDIRFVAVTSADSTADVYTALTKEKNFEVITDRSPHLDAAVASFDVLLSPFNDLATSLPLQPHTKRIAYVNDLIPLNQPGFPEFLRDRYEDTARRADATLCLSESTRGELVQRLGVDPASCFVAPPAIDDLLTVVPVAEQFEPVDDHDIRKARQSVGVKFEYLIYPAAFRRHKNHERLFEAMRYTYSNLQLVLTTGESHDPAAQERIEEVIRRRNMGHRILVAGNLSTEEYRGLLKGARALVFPSLEEGFGIPVVEAQALRVPVIASRRGSLADVAKGSLEIDPFDPMDIADKITLLTSDDELSAQIAESGWQNSRRFTKEWGAHGFVEAINYVLE